MSTSRSLARRGIVVARRLSNPGGRLPRRAYAHCFIEEDGVHSRLHLHHFYSMFLPDVTEPVDAHVRVFDAGGRVLGDVSRQLAPFTSLTLPVAGVLAELGSTATLGTVAVDVDPGEAYAKRLVESGPDGAMTQSPFWMGYYDAGGSVAYVHSIDQYYGEAFGVGRLGSLTFRSRWHRGGPWTSKRLIDAQDLRRVDAYLVNHSPAAGRTTIRWVTHPDSRTVVERTASVPAHGAIRVSVAAGDLVAAGGAVQKIRLEVDGLLTENGKPYVMVRYGEGPFSLHHG
ncbi:MAG: hypothetical protein JF886_14540 [Candidatus Dormibacteraeota bacterium]|uniref:Uncharacterized protein n=1 Tax=Candidatus Aeolococcus gillhamiae TaxID=3127015 RepID=A0A2W6ARJ5_9BACT|nr:hypothetical protein [Candidatus Dormibacteraeota bacterium]PZR80411.1 MAG: hypothetical protein DLM65_08235 [Candidatus Dormibacter sp. RRmetagenome_bin12]